MTAVINVLQNVRPREVSGSWTSARYDFQKHLSILILLELQDSGQDYRMAFDHFDDIVMFNHSENPTLMTLYQIKAREDGPWEIKHLIENQSSSVPRTIISKMYDHIARLGDLVESVNLATNAIFKLPLAVGGQSGTVHLRICAAELEEKALAKLNTAIDLDFPQPRACGTSCTYFRRFGLSVLDQEAAVRGKLQEFFDRAGSADFVPTKALYMTLFETTARKSRVGNTYVSLQQCYESKTIDRATISKLFDQAATGRRLDQFWGAIAHELTQGGVGFFEQTKIRTFAHSYVAHRAAGKRLAIRFAEIASGLIETHEDQLLVIGSLLGRLTVLELATITSSNIPYSDLQRRAAFIVHLLEHGFGEEQHYGAEEAPEQFESTE